MYKRILVAIDGSLHANQALSHALGMAKAMAAALRVVHVVDTGWLGLGMELAIDTQQLELRRRKAGEDLLAEAHETAQRAGMDVETRLVETATPADHVAALIARETIDWPADLVVLGTHGGRRLDRMLLGGVAERVARLSAVPILLVPA